MREGDLVAIRTHYQRGHVIGRVVDSHQGIYLVTRHVRGTRDARTATTAPSLLSHKRGNDGLTDAERAAYAAPWRNGAGAAPSRDEMKRLRGLTTRQAG